MLTIKDMYKGVPYKNAVQESKMYVQNAAGYVMEFPIPHELHDQLARFFLDGQHADAVRFFRHDPVELAKHWHRLRDELGHTVDGSPCVYSVLEGREENGTLVAYDTHGVYVHEADALEDIVLRAEKANAMRVGNSEFGGEMKWVQPNGDVLWVQQETIRHERDAVQETEARREER